MVMPFGLTNAPAVFMDLMKEVYLHHSIASLLTKLTHKEVRFVWLKECVVSFQEFKERLTSAAMLAFPSGTKGFRVFCNDLAFPRPKSLDFFLESSGF